MGTYPSFAFTPSDSAVIIWAAGQIYSVPLSVNARGEKVALPVNPGVVRFEAHVEKQLAETRRSKTDLIGMETQETQRVYAFKELKVNEGGEKAVFQAAGVTYVQSVQGDSSPLPQKVPVKHVDQAYYSPSFVPGADDLVLHARWSDTNFSTFELANLTSGTAHEIMGLPLGRYYSPVLCECSGRGRQIAFVRTGGDLLTGDIVATAGVGIYVGSITIPDDWSISSRDIEIRNVRFVPSELDTWGLIKMRFVEGNKKLLVEQSREAFVIDLGAGPDELGDYTHTTLVSGRMSQELVVAPASNNAVGVPEWVAFVDFYNVYVTAGDNVDVEEEESVWSKPANATKGLARVSLDGGHDIVWSKDGKKIFWLLGKIYCAIILIFLTIITWQVRICTRWNSRSSESALKPSRTTHLHSVSHVLRP